jgi:outer membrane biosynthesis protein TonB
MENTTTTERNFSTIGTIVFHGLFALILIFMMRDCSGGGQGDGTQYMGLEIASLGDYEAGGGESDEAATQAAPNSSSPTEDQQVETQTESDVSTPKSNPNTTVKPNPNPNPNQNNSQNQNNNNTKPNPLFDKLNENNNPPKGPGDDPTKTPGNPNGLITGKGVLGGAGGNGGAGSGGSGYEWAFTRGMASPPELADQITVQGSIEVDIVVDKTGKVISAIPKENTIKGKGSNGDPKVNVVAEIVRLAKKAALTARFNPDPQGGPNKAGKITINFKLK